MTASALITAYRKNLNSSTEADLSGYFSFKTFSLESGKVTDANLYFRTEIVEALLHDFTLRDIRLIRRLFEEEMRCESVIHRHDNLYQLCFYLYDLGQLEDTFILYDAKFNAAHMDVGLSLDSEAMTVGHEVEEVIEYVTKEFKKKPELKEKYPKIIAELQRLLESSNYSSIEEYSEFLKAYFYE